MGSLSGLLWLSLDGLDKLSSEPLANGKPSLLVDLAAHFSSIMLESLAAQSTSGKVTLCLI